MRIIVDLPDWDDSLSEDEFRAMKNAGWILPDVTHEKYNDWDIEWDEKVSEDALNYWVDAYSGRRIIRADTFGSLLEELGKIERAYCYPYRFYPCNECKGTGRGLQGGMRGAVYTQEDFNEDPEFYHDMMNGRYDGECQGCGGRGGHNIAEVHRAFEPYTREYDEWVKEQRKTCENDYAFDWNGRQHKRPDAELTKKMNDDGHEGQWTWRWRRNAFWASGKGATEQEARDDCQAQYDAANEKNNRRNATMTMRLEEQAGYKWDVGFWQTTKAIEKWKETGVFKLTGTPTIWTEEIEWTQEREDDLLKRLHEMIIGRRWVAYGSCTHEYPVRTKWNQCHFLECIPSDDPQWAVRLFYAMERQNERDRKEAAHDRQTMWGEMGVPLHERY